MKTSKPKSKWTSVFDKLPDHNQLVLAKNEECQFKATFMANYGWTYRNDIDDDWQITVTHWKPIKYNIHGH